MIDSIMPLAAQIIPIVIAIVFHEVAHGWVARALGDPTAAEARRLTLNPLRHIDPLGTVLLPAVLALVHAPVFGWAKPVPVDKRRLRNPRWGMMAVAAAGPLTNFILAALGAIALGLLLRWVEVPTAASRFIATNLTTFIAINIFLALFNLLPIPPFDGSHIVEGLLPTSAARGYARLRPFALGFMVLLLVVVPMVAPQMGIVQHVVAPPFEWAIGHYYELMRFVAGQ